MPTRELQCVLLVEDDPDHAELIQLVLRDCPAVQRIDRVSDGVKALDYLHRRGDYAGETARPELVLLDLRLPGVSGMEVLRHMKFHPELKSIPVVILTTSNRRQEVQDCYDLGANSFVTKPVDFADFQRCVNEIGVYWGTVSTPPGAPN